MTERRITYTKDFKIQAVELLNTSGKPGRQIADELGIGGGVQYASTMFRRVLRKRGFYQSMSRKKTAREKALHEVFRAEAVSRCPRKTIGSVANRVSTKSGEGHDA
ncbi:MAG: transposase [Spirochaetales bacterium]|nr:transposase [Spirochaetales bacterium]